jgi:hypothetical protein
MCAMDPVALTEFNIISGPSLYDRLLTHYKLNDKEINRIIGEHNLTSEGAELLLTQYPPLYDNTKINDQLPLRRLELSNTAKDVREGINPFLINRQNGYIINNFYGVPYIAEGNKLMFI